MLDATDFAASVVIRGLMCLKGISLTPLDLGVNPGSFEYLCVRITSISSSCVAVLVYRPPSASVSAFVSEPSDILDCVVTFSDPLFVVGDANIHLERNDDPDRRQFADALNARGLVCHVTVTPPTHDCGGTIDIVVTLGDLPAPSIDVINVGSKVFSIGFPNYQLIILDHVLYSLDFIDVCSQKVIL